MEDKLCEYGCNNKAKYQLKNKKWCCENSYNKCSAIRKKNTEGLKKAYKEGRKDPNLFTQEHRDKSRQSNLKRAIKTTFKLNSNKCNTYIKKLLFEQLGYERKCQNCGINEWDGKPITLELDHIDGNSYNNELNNLKVLCPNCHSQTPTFRYKNSNPGYRKVKDEKLIEALKSTKSIHEALKKVNLVPKGGNYVRGYRLLKFIEENEKES